MPLLRTSHLGPTLLVTLVSYLIAVPLWWEGPALVIAFTVFTGQLCVGWTNDLIDIENDQAQNRRNKPLASGEIKVATVRRATFIALAFCIAFSLIGPLGILGGSVHLLGVGCGVAYNFYLKATIFSPVPYIIAFAALPSCIVLSKNDTVPFWLICAGSLFGIAAHFANVIKDLEIDRSAGVLGFPQRVGARMSALISAISLLLVAIILNAVTGLVYLIFFSLLGFILLFALPKRFTFYVIMLTALIDVFVLVTSAASSLALTF